MNKGIVSTGSKEATQSAADILRAGGNAFDAAVAAVFTSMTSEFALTGVGGGGAMMLSNKGNEPILYDFFVDAPKNNSKNKLDFFGVDINFGDSSQKFHIGKGSAAIPGTLAGLVAIQNQYGSLPLSAVLESAIYLARNGCMINDKQAYIIKILEPIFSYTKEGRQLFYRNGKLLQEGDIFSNSYFATFLERVSVEGDSFFYNGELAEIISCTFGNGGLLNMEALQNYHVAIRKPIITNYNETKVYSNPAPSVGGTLIIFLLHLLEKSRFKKINNSLLINAMGITNYARYKICTDPNDEYQINHLLDNGKFSKYLDMFESMTVDFQDYENMPGRGSTTHVSVIDKNFNAASVTTTNGEGCGYFIPETGIMMNNMLGEEDLNPLGFHQWKNPLRLPTMISPTIIMKENKPYILLGSGGSNRIRSAITQVITNFIGKKMDVEEAISSPRLHLEGNNLYIEPGIVLDEIIPEQIVIHEFREKNLFFGGVNAVTVNQGVSDLRRGGTYAIV